jgi:hypothetical protein
VIAMTMSSRDQLEHDVRYYKLDNEVVKGQLSDIEEDVCGLENEIEELKTRLSLYESPFGTPVDVPLVKTGPGGDYSKDFEGVEIMWLSSIAFCSVLAFVAGMIFKWAIS